MDEKSIILPLHSSNVLRSSIFPHSPQGLNWLHIKEILADDKNDLIVQYFEVISHVKLITLPGRKYQLYLIWIVYTSIQRNQHQITVLISKEIKKLKRT